MQIRGSNLLLAFAFMMASGLLGACQPTLPPVSIHDLPVYPGAVELQTGANTPDDLQVQEWLNRDAQDRDASKEKIIYKRFRLPNDLSNPELMPFYSNALQKGGWQPRWGNVPARQTFTRGAQYLALYVFSNKTTGDTELLMTLDK